MPKRSSPRSSPAWAVVASAVWTKGVWVSFVLNRLPKEVASVASVLEAQGESHPVLKRVVYPLVLESGPRRSREGSA